MLRSEARRTGPHTKLIPGFGKAIIRALKILEKMTLRFSVFKKEERSLHGAVRRRCRLAESESPGFNSKTSNQDFFEFELLNQKLRARTAFESSSLVCLI